MAGEQMGDCSALGGARSLEVISNESDQSFSIGTVKVGLLLLPHSLISYSMSTLAFVMNESYPCLLFIYELLELQLSAGRL